MKLNKNKSPDPKPPKKCGKNTAEKIRIAAGYGAKLHRDIQQVLRQQLDEKGGLFFMNQPLPPSKTADEARQEFLTYIRSFADYWATIPNATIEKRTHGVAFSILNFFDEGANGFPPLKVVLDPAPLDPECLPEAGDSWYAPGTAINDGAVYLHELYCDSGKIKTKRGRNKPVEK
jgi:hypothetical protein